MLTLGDDALILWEPYAGLNRSKYVFDRPKSTQARFNHQAVKEREVKGPGFGNLSSADENAAIETIFYSGTLGVVQGLTVRNTG